MPIKLDPEIIQNVINVEAGQADHFQQEVKRIREESIYLDDELDRLIKTEFLIEQRHYNENLKQDRDARKKYAHMTFILTCIWAGLIFLVVFSDADGSLCFITPLKFRLSDKVLITLITSTTINFFGFFLLVMKYLFHTESKRSDYFNKVRDKLLNPKKDKSF